MITGLDDVLERVRPFGMTTSTTLGSLRRSTRIIWFQLTDGRLKLFKQLHREVVSLYEAGYNVIVDTTLMDRRALLDAAQCFAPLQGFFTGLKPPLEISEAWEIRRVDRPPGQVRKHYDLVHAHHTYDLLLDPSKMTSEECARLILQSCESIMPTAFQRLLQQSD
jgi:chloramphenicol 3-O-phosphotransferase